jgi:cell division protein FtsB
MGFLQPVLVKHKGAVIGTALTVLLGIALAGGHRGVGDLLALLEEERALEQQMVRMQRGNEDMRRHLERMQGDPLYLERVIRERLGWARPGEIVYRIERARN